jgi:hypothetical protein
MTGAPDSSGDGSRGEVAEEVVEEAGPDEARELAFALLRAAQAEDGEASVTPKTDDSVESAQGNGHVTSPFMHNEFGGMSEPDGEFHAYVGYGGGDSAVNISTGWQRDEISTGTLVRLDERQAEQFASSMYHYLALSQDSASDDEEIPSGVAGQIRSLLKGGSA